MKKDLMDFQVEAVAALKKAFVKAQATADDEVSAVLLSAPTGSGKTLMATALLEELLEGSEEDGEGGDPDMVFLWLTDQPELNKQTMTKMLRMSSVFSDHNLVVIDGGFDAEQFEPGNVYFLNTQKLGANTSFVKTGDGRTYTLWETVNNTVEAAPSKFVLILDEAHRGAKGRDATEADTIMQTFMKGSDELTPVPLVLGISATPDRFVKLCGETNRPLRRYEVDPAQVRESGLLKEYVDLWHPDEAQPSKVSLLSQAIDSWLEYTDKWSSYEYSEGEDVVRPVLVIQVEDAQKGSNALSATDLDMVVGTLIKKVPHEQGDTSWLTHAFQDDTDHVIAGHTVRYVAPSEIDDDDNVKVVLFKMSLNTGWDCPRAEVMMSFRSAVDDTNIAQLVGRMVRAPLTRRVDGVEFLNTVSLYLPDYDHKVVDKVVARLSTDPNNVPPMQVRDGGAAVSLSKAGDKTECFAVLEQLPTSIIPRVRVMKPVPRLAKLAALLNELGMETDAVKMYRTELVKVLLDERKRLSDDPNFKKRVDENTNLDMRRRRVAYGLGEKDGAKPHSANRKVEEADIDDLYAEAGRMLGEGLHREYMRTRRKNLTKGKDFDAFAVKVELHALVTTDGVLAKVQAAADALRQKWTNEHKAAIGKASEKARQTWRDIEGAGSEPALTTIHPESSIETKKADAEWRDHLYVEADGKYREDFKSSWESRALATELANNEVIGWLRNQDRKPWSLCVPRKDKTTWVGIYPDFIIFRKTKGGVIADIVDPHLLNDANAPARAQALAQYAAKHSDKFGRIELLIYQSQDDPTGKRLDLLDEPTRSKVAGVSTHEHLKQLFEQA